MYNAREDILNLVQSLNNGEKRHFTNSIRQDGTVPLYAQLFYEFEKGKSSLPKELLGIDARSLTSAKRRLYGNIIDSLISLHQDSSINLSIQKQLSSIEILYRKGLAEQGLVIWHKVYKIALEHEKLALLLQVLDWEKRQNIVIDKPSRTSTEIKKEENEVLNKLAQILKLESLYSHIMVFKKQFGFAKGALRAQLETETIASAEMPKLTECLTNTAIFYYNLIHSVYHWMVFEHQKGFAYSKKTISQSANNILPNDYIAGIMQHITSSVCMGYFKETLDGIELGNAFIEEYKLNQSNVFRRLMFAYQSTYRIVVYNYMGKRSALKQTVKDTEHLLLQYDNFLPLELRQVITGNLMVAYIGLGNLDKADELWSLMMDKQFKIVRQDINADLYVFRLFSLLHSRTYSLLPSAALSAVRFYRKDEHAQQRFDVELPIAMLLQKERDYKPKVIREVMEAAKKIVQQFIGTLKGINNFQEHYTRYIIWCDAIMNNEPFHEAAARWYEGYTNKQLQLSGSSKKRLK